MNEITTTAPEIKEWHQITIDEYFLAKQEITNRLKNMSEDYIVIGYYLRQIKDTQAYVQEGFNNLKDFAKSEFNLSESQVSRFIAINQKFSKWGCSKEIASEYKGFGVGKLSEMITMSEEDRKLVTVGTTVSQIRDIKQFNREAEELAAVQPEEQIPVQLNVEETITMYESGEIPSGGAVETVVAEIVQPARVYSNLETVLIEFFRDKKELLNSIYGLSLSNVEDVVEQINPSGNIMFRHKALMLFMYEYGSGVILKKMVGDKETYSWSDVIQTIVNIYKDTYTDHDSVHQNFYGEETKEKESGSSARDNSKATTEKKPTADEAGKKTSYDDETSGVEGATSATEEGQTDNASLQTEEIAGEVTDEVAGDVGQAEEPANTVESKLGEAPWSTSKERLQELQAKINAKEIVTAFEYYEYIHEKPLSDRLYDIIDGDDTTVNKTVNIGSEISKLIDKYVEYRLFAEKQ
ncbi:MAG: hypothetical protein IJV71_12065 [Lachnospiraceae bacterium]|nr:hypothetical protein [Lachnospiraceae bacterium]